MMFGCVVLHIRRFLGNVASSMHSSLKVANGTGAVAPSKPSTSSHVYSVLTHIDVENIVKQISYRDWQFRVGREAQSMFLQVRFAGACALSGHPSLQSGRKWRISAHMTRSEVVQTALLAVLTAEKHEVHENFRCLELVLLVVPSVFFCVHRMSDLDRLHLLFLGASYVLVFIACSTGHSIFHAHYDVDRLYDLCVASAPVTRAPMPERGDDITAV